MVRSLGTIVTTWNHCDHCAESDSILTHIGHILTHIGAEGAIFTVLKVGCESYVGRLYGVHHTTVKLPLYLILSNAINLNPPKLQIELTTSIQSLMRLSTVSYDC